MRGAARIDQGGRHAGSLRLSPDAPAGCHDDRVTALSLAHSKRRDHALSPLMPIPIAHPLRGTACVAARTLP